MSNIELSSRHNRLLRQTQLSWNANSNLSFDCWKSLICLTGHTSPFGIFEDVKCPMKNISRSIISKKLVH